MSKTMKKKSTFFSRVSKWDLAIILTTLIILSASTVANFYQKQPAIVISNSPSLGFSKTDFSKAALSKKQPPINSQKLLNLLQQNNIQVLQTSTENGKVEFTLTNEEQQNQAVQLLQKHNGKQLSVKKSAIDTRPTWLQKLNLEPIKLGLDLNGGILLIYQVDSDYALKQKLVTIQQLMKKHLRENRIHGIKSEINQQGFLQLKANANSRLKETASWLLNNFNNLIITREKPRQMLLAFADNYRSQFHRQIMAQSSTLLRERIEKLGITESNVQRQGADKIRIELPGLKDKAEAERIIGTTATLDFYQLAQHGEKFSWPDGQSVYVDPIPIFTGKNISDAQAGRDELGIPSVNLLLDEIGGDKMLNFSSQNIGAPMVTVFSEYHKDAHGETKKQSKVINVATIQQALSSRFSITNLDSPTAAQALAESIRAGSLSAPITQVKHQTISATLGHSNITNGFKALALGFAVTLIFMGLWYKRLGLIANLSLFVNLVCLIGLLSILPGTVLTLPGIAGLVLTVGMAVDTNVLIFERIKLESQKARNSFHAIEAGYNNAFKTIFDANITTLITAIILYSIGFGPIKGFATTLCLGILTSMFSGIFVSRVLTRVFCQQIKITQVNRGAHR